jgi:hypothetical protein
MITRRTVLKGLGVTMALPWLETLAAGADTAPPRMAVVFMGNGVNTKEWWAKNTDKGLELSSSLSPLAPVKDQLLVFKGLWNPSSVAGPGGHYPKMNVLSGLKVKQTTTDVAVGTTMDQVVARSVGQQTPVPSIALGTEGPRYFTDNGYTSMYSAYVSWSTPTTPLPKEIYPQLAFDQLFADGSKSVHDKSILDAVLGDAKSLTGQLSSSDKLKLDEYLTSVRELEQRIARAAAKPEAKGWKPALDKPNMARPDNGIPRDANEHLRLMMDIMVLALQMDRTRVITNMMTNDLSNMNIDNAGGGQHEISHHANNPDQLKKYAHINRACVRLWSEALQKMNSIQEGERTLLENSMVMFCSSLMDGNAHDSKQLPVLLAGRGGGTIKGGRHMDFSGEKDRRMCRLHLAMMERMGVHLDRFGDADKAMNLG